jgi:threonine aldolase
MKFYSDNVTGCAPEILEQLVASNSLKAMPYGADELTSAAEVAFRQVFESDLETLLVATGTAANSLALAAIAPSHGAVFCVRGSHIEASEGGAVEFMTGGAKLVSIEGDAGKLLPERLEAALADHDEGASFRKPAAVSITQASELGTVYSAGEIAALASIAHGNGLKLHVDGARWANALACAGTTPAELSWRAGVDVLSLGATKNGALAAEAVLFFDSQLMQGVRERRKRSGMLLSKHRFLAVQFLAFFNSGLWLDLARHANAQAQKLRGKLAAYPAIAIVHPVEVNLVFARLPTGLTEHLAQGGAEFHQRKDGAVRFATSFATTDAEIDALIAAIDDFFESRKTNDRPADFHIPRSTPI